MAKNMRVHELAKELGMTNGEAMDLASALGVPVKSHSSSLNEAYADMIRRRAVRDGLTRDEQPEEPKPVKKTTKKAAAKAETPEATETSARPSRPPRSRPATSPTRSRSSRSCRHPLRLRSSSRLRPPSPHLRRSLRPSNRTCPLPSPSPSPSWHRLLPNLRRARSAPSAHRSHRASRHPLLRRSRLATSRTRWRHGRSKSPTQNE